MKEIFKKTIRKKILIFSIIVLLFLFGVVLVDSGLGATCQDHELWGWAWSDIGWISFSCTNETSIGSGIDYGVDIDENNDKLEGYAWSESIGWISFNIADLTSCPTEPCEAGIDVSGGSGALSGWARALSPVGKDPSQTGGWDGWISLARSSYQVTFNSDPNPSEFEGWAWGHNVVGWISFNSTNCDSDGNGFKDVSCGGDNATDVVANYAVYTNLLLNEAPTAISLNVTDGNYCSSSSPPIFLNWTFDDPGDTQASYNIEVDDNSDFSSPEVVDSGTTSETYAPVLGVDSFNETYYWRVDVSDGISSSGWINGPNFTTDPRWPQPSFTYGQDPLSLDVTFDGSADYCTGCSYSWDFGDGVGTSNLEDLIYTYLAEATYDVTLTAQSSVGSCTINPAVQVIVGPGLGLPDWEEIIPF